MESASFGFQKVYGGGEVGWRIRCAKCGTRYQAKWGPKTSTDLMVKNLRRLGWEVRQGHDAICPDCLKGKPAMKNGSSNGAAPAVAVPPSATATASAAAVASITDERDRARAKMRRVVYACLEEHFDIDKGLYHAGWSDERVAKETGASTVFVGTERSKAFADLAENPIITTLRDDLELFRLEVDDIARRFNVEWETLTQRYAALRARLDGLAGKI